jgi:hypothetical protein
LTLIWLLLVVGCRHRPPETPVTKADEAAPPPEALAEPPLPPGPWQEPGGLHLTIPEGWTGLAGGPRGCLVRLRHSETGVAVDLFAVPARGEAQPLGGRDCTITFSDGGLHRAVPLLSPSRTALCVSDEPGGDTIEEWYAVVGDREIHVQAVYPASHALDGRTLVEPILAALGGR